MTTPHQFATLQGSEAEADELVVCGWDEVFILHLKREHRQTPAKVWSWKAQDRTDLPAHSRELFKTTDECKPVRGGGVLITSSTSGVALAERETGNVLFHAVVPNAHSAELLPAGRAVVASSGAEEGNRLVVFNLNGPPEPVCTDEMSWAHGVVWDAQREVLWALGRDELRAYELRDWASPDPSLSRVATFDLPDPGGHDLSPVPHTPLLVVTAQEHVYQFDRDERRFAPHPLLGNVPCVKGVSVHPASGQIAYVQAEGEHWWAETIRFLEPEGVLHEPDAHFYKARWDAAAQEEPEGAGRVSRKQAPSFTVSSRRRSPPMLRARRRLSARPRPTPGAELAASRADLRNGRNRFGASFRNTPGP